MFTYLVYCIDKHFGNVGPIVTSSSDPLQEDMDFGTSIASWGHSTNHSMVRISAISAKLVAEEAGHVGRPAAAGGGGISRGGLVGTHFFIERSMENI